MKTLGWLLSLFILCSCNNGDRLTKDVMELMGRKITFPTGYESLSYHESLSAVDFTPHWATAAIHTHGLSSSCPMVRRHPSTWAVLLPKGL